MDVEFSADRETWMNPWVVHRAKPNWVRVRALVLGRKGQTALVAFRKPGCWAWLDGDGDSVRVDVPEGGEITMYRPVDVGCQGGRLKVDVF